MRALVVEDEAGLRNQLAGRLRGAGYAVDAAGTARDAQFFASEYLVDVAVVDLGLPDGSGLDLIRGWRRGDLRFPVLILTARGRWQDKVEGLEAGADDYLVKPFSFQELSARLSALTRRPPLKTEETLLQVADLEMNLIRRTVTRAGVPLGLQPREFSLLEYLMRNAGRVLTRTMLLEAVWDFHFDPKTNVVETHISRLRNKVDKPFDRELIHTVRGAGYSLHG